LAAEGEGKGARLPASEQSAAGGAASDEYPNPSRQKRQKNKKKFFSANSQPVAEQTKKNREKFLKSHPCVPSARRLRLFPAAHHLRHSARGAALGRRAHRFKRRAVTE